MDATEAGLQAENVDVLFSFGTPIRRVLIKTKQGFFLPVFSVLDLVKTAKECSTASAKGIAWRILSMLSEDTRKGLIEAVFSPGEEGTLGADAEMAVEIMLLVPGSETSNRLRARAVRSLLGLEEDACVPIMKEYHQKRSFSSDKVRHLLLASMVLLAVTRFSLQLSRLTFEVSR